MMLTSRGFCMLVLFLSIFIVGVVNEQPLLILLGLASMIWIAVTWMIFAVRALTVIPRLTFERRINDQAAGRAALWAGQAARVGVDLQCNSDFGAGMLQITDCAPAAGTVTGRSSESGSCDAAQTLTLGYSFRPQAPGCARFQGLRIKAVDPNGCFQFDTFLHDPVEVNVLPRLVDHRGTQNTFKRVNELPMHGVHRHPRRGSGTELLDLRDYIPGDPPKSIAWKISARRDRLITKEYESEVPIRCTLFVDVTESMRIGAPGQSMLYSSIEIVAALARQLVGNRDPVGLTLIDSNSASILAPAPGQRHLARLYARLARASARPVRPTPCPLENVLEPMVKFCRETYPKLLDSRLNRPGPWLRIGLAIVSMRYAGWGLLIVAVAVALALVISGAASPQGVIAVLLGFLGAVFAALASMRFAWWFGAIAVATLTVGLALSGSLPPQGAIASLLAFLVAVFVGSFVLRILRIGRSPVAFLRSRFQQKQLAAVLAAYGRLGPGGTALLTKDPHALAEQAQQFLNDHRIPFDRPLYGLDGHYLFADPEKVGVVSRCLLRAIAHCRDNELFVVMMYLLELQEHWQDLLHAIKVALARHHQVVVVCPWPPGLPFPTSTEWPDEELAAADPLHRRFQDPARAMLHLDLLRHRQAYESLQRQLAQLGVPLVCRPPNETVTFILDRIEQLRSAAIRR